MILLDGYIFSKTRYIRYYVTRSEDVEVFFFFCNTKYVFLSRWNSVSIETRMLRAEKEIAVDNNCR